MVTVLANYNFMTWFLVSVMVTCVLLLAGSRVQAFPQSDPQQVYLNRITHDIEYLASDEMAGRQPGTPGIKLAEDYIVGEYKKAGLMPLPMGRISRKWKSAMLKTSKKILPIWS